jgi:serine/threonine-protein kinase
VPDDPRVQQFLEELFSSGGTPEEVCGSCIELLPVVRERWQRVVRIRAELAALFPAQAQSASRLLTSPPADTPFPDIPGYEFEAVLGAGGMGVVFKARHLRLNRVVALKMTLAGAYAGARERERFQREAEAVAVLRHPNVVQIHDIGDSHGKPYFTMEYVEGGSLAEKLAGTPLPAHDAAALLSTLASAVQAAHANGIVHRDLKPGNVLLTADGTPKIGDFGLARRLGAEGGLTRTGAGLGTPSYMAPEQARGTAGAVGPSADIYSLGAILYELLTGRPPFRAESAAETVHQLLTQDPVPPSRLNGKVPRDLETICLKCLSKEAKLRYSTADALNDDLNRFLRGDAIAARPVGRVRCAVRAVRRRPTLSVAVTAGVLIAALVLAGGSWLLFDGLVVDRAASGELDEAEELLQKASFTQAKAAIERARARLGTRTSSALRQRLDQCTRDWEFADRLERIGLDSWTIIGNPGSSRAHFNSELVDQNYDEAFHEFGIGRYGDDPDTVAARIRESRILVTLLSALDRWSVVARTPAREAWVMKVADRAEPERTPWRKDARDPNMRRDRQALLGLIARADILKESAPLLLAVSSTLRTNIEPPGPSGYGTYDITRIQVSKLQVPFLTAVQRGHPADLWANIDLGYALILGDKPDEAVRYFQTVVALRPNWSVGYQFLGQALVSPTSSRAPEEAVVYFRKALELEPNSAVFNHSLAEALRKAGKHDEAISQAEGALRYNYNVARLRSILGASLKANGRVEEGFAQLRLALSLEPDNQWVQNEYRFALSQERRWNDLRAVWGEILKGDRPAHDDWYGYAEMCLYLGQEDEYRRARTALLTRFGTSTTPVVAERTARACLLLPLSGEDLSKAGSLAAFAARANPSYSYFQFVKGFAEYRQGHHDRAIAILRGDASRMPGPLPLLVLSMALHSTGKKAEARQTFASAMLNHNWRENQVRDQDGWINHVLRREAERMLYPNLMAMLEGKHQPRDNHERLAPVGVCRFENRLAALVRIYADAFEVDRQLQIRYRLTAARVAVQAGCGCGIDAVSASDAERRSWRALARGWLREELAARRDTLTRDFNEARDTVRQALMAWQNEPDLAGIREPAELEKLVAEERTDCLKFWAEVNAVLASTSGPK